MKLFVCALTAALLASCASSPTVKTDHDPAADFSSYHSYYWAHKPEGPSPLVEQRIVAGVDARLQAKGWTLGEGSGDIALVANIATSQKQTVDTFYTGTGMGGWGYRGGWGGGMGMASSTSTVRTYDVGTLIVDMFDASTKQAVWRGSASATVPSSTDKVNATVDAALDKMFAAFPPGSVPAK